MASRLNPNRWSPKGHIGNPVRMEMMANFIVIGAQMNHPASIQVCHPRFYPPSHLSTILPQCRVPCHSISHLRTTRKVLNHTLAGRVVAGTSTFMCPKPGRQAIPGEASTRILLRQLLQHLRYELKRPPVKNEVTGSTGAQNERKSKGHQTILVEPPGGFPNTHTVSASQVVVDLKT